MYKLPFSGPLCLFSDIWLQCKTKNNQNPSLFTYFRGESRPEIRSAASVHPWSTVAEGTGTAPSSKAAPCRSFAFAQQNFVGITGKIKGPDFLLSCRCYRWAPTPRNSIEHFAQRFCPFFDFQAVASPRCGLTCLSGCPNRLSVLHYIALYIIILYIFYKFCQTGQIIK